VIITYKFNDVTRLVLYEFYLESFYIFWRQW